MNEKDVERLKERLAPLEGALGNAIWIEAKTMLVCAPVNPAAAVGRARVALETMLADVYRRTRKADPAGLSVDQLRTQLRKAMPETVHAHVQTVQSFGNMGNHARPKSMEGEDARIALDAFVVICEWYARTHGRRLALGPPLRRFVGTWRRLLVGAVATVAIAVVGGAALTGLAGWWIVEQIDPVEAFVPPTPVLDVTTPTVPTVEVIGAGTAPAVVVDGSAAVEGAAVVGAADAQPLEEVLPGLPDFDRVVVARGGLTMSRNPAYKAKRLRKKDPQADAEVCRVAEGAPVERLDAERGYVRLRAWCGGAVQEGWALEKIDRAATLEAASKERTLVALGDVALAEEQVEIARAAFAAALKESPGHVDAIAGLARADQVRALAEERRRGLVREMAIGP